MDTDLRQRWLLLWRPNRRLFVFFFITLLMDTLSTMHFMRTLGPESELHPLVRLICCTFGIVLGPLIAAAVKALVLAAVLLCHRRFARAVLLIAGLLHGLACFYNLYVADLYFEDLLPWLPF